MKIRQLEGNGDFRSDECIEFLKQADVVVTNPPFSLFRQYVKQLMDYGKKFIIIGSAQAITYKEIFPYIKDNEMWLGATKLVDFKTYSGEMSKVYCYWYSNVEHKRRNQPIDLYKKYSDEYKHYYNYDAIDVPKVCDIPMDYDGVMGVPISFLDKYCPNQFEIIGRSGDREFVLSGIDFYKPFSIEDEVKARATGNCFSRYNIWYKEKDGIMKEGFKRLFIKRTA